jgi:hypothetical protein
MSGGTIHGSDAGDKANETGGQGAVLTNRPVPCYCFSIVKRNQLRRSRTAPDLARFLLSLSLLI